MNTTQPNPLKADGPFAKGKRKGEKENANATSGAFGETQNPHWQQIAKKPSTNLLPPSQASTLAGYGNHYGAIGGPLTARGVPHHKTFESKFVSRASRKGATLESNSLSRAAGLSGDNQIKGHEKKDFSQTMDFRNQTKKPHFGLTKTQSAILHPVLGLNSRQPDQMGHCPDSDE